MAQDNLSFSWELRGTVEKQIKEAAENAESLRMAIDRLNIDLSKLSEDKKSKALAKNVSDAEKALYRLYEVKEKVDKAISRNMSMRSDGFLGMDDSKLLQASERLENIINQVMNIGAEAKLSKTAVKDLLSSLSADVAIKDAKNITSLTDKGLDKQVREHARAQKETAKELAKAFEDADKAEKNNIKNQELIKDALAKIATARANLSAATEKGNQQEIAHAQLLMNLLDRLSGKLSTLKGQFLGEKGALDGILGGGYSGLMRNVSAAIRDIGSINSNIVQSPVKLITEQDTTAIRSQIDLIGALHMQIKRLYEELGRAANNSNRIMPTNWQELAGKGLYNSKSPYVEQMEFLKKLRAYDGDMTKQRSVVEENIQRLQSQLNVYREAGINVQGYQNHLNALYETYVKLNALQSTTDLSAKLGLEHLRGYTGPQSALSDEAWASAKREAEIREVAIAAAEKHRNKLAELTEAFSRQAKAEEKAKQAEAEAIATKERATQRAHKRAQASAEAERVLRKEAQEVVNLRIEMLKTQAAQLNGLIKNGSGVFNTSQLEQYRNALKDIVSEITTLKSVVSNISGFTSRELFGFGLGNGRMGYADLITHGQQAYEASKAVQLLSESEQKFAKSLIETSSALSRNSALLSDLKMMATQYLSLWGVRGYINSIIETGGLLEQQRLSIGAILGSIDKAEVVFGKIKDLAIKSPFGVVQLDTMSKQLTAYGFQYEELFDWTKRLADISAATGTEVSRLALALGHVRAEGALSGYTLRQFAMANVPMLQNLANNLGITTKEVRERTKKKEIGYSDVKKVLEDLTNEGGMFFNAQEIMSEALNAKYKNLRDAFDIMYGEIAESGVGDLLKGIAEALTAGAKEWRRFGADILWVAGAFGIAKAASLAYSQGMITLSKQMGILAINTRAYTAEQVQQLATEGAVTREQLLRAVASGRLSVEQARLAATTLGVSSATLQQAASTGVVTKAMLGNAMATSRYTVAQLRLMATLKAQGALFPALRVGLMGLAAGIRTLGAAFKTFLPFLAIGAIVDFFSRYSQQLSSAKESAHEAVSSMSTGLGNIKSLYDSLNKKTPQGDAELTTAIQNMKDALKDEGAYNSIKAQVEGTKDLQEQYNILYERLQSISEEYVRMKYSTEAYIEAANNVGGGLLTDNMEEDIKQYGQAVVKKDVAKQRAGQYDKMLKREIEAYLKSEGKWVKEMQNKTWDELANYIKDGKELSSFRNSIFKKESSLRKEGQDGEANYYKDASKAIQQYILALRNVGVARKEVDEQMPEYVTNIKGGLSEFANSLGLDVSQMVKWDDSSLKAYIRRLDEELNSYKIPEEARQHIRNEIIKTFPKEVQIRIRAIKSNKPAELEGWRKDLQKYFDSHGINIKLTADESIQDVEKKLQEARDKAQKKMNSAGAILTYWKITPDLSAVKNFIAKHPKLKNLIESVFGDYTESKKTVSAINQAHVDTGLDVIKKTKSNKGGSKSDPEAKRLREEIKLIKDAYSWYKKYDDELKWSSEDAFKEIEKKYGDTLKKLGISWDSEKGITEYVDTIKKKLAEAEKLYSQPKHKNSYMMDVIKELKDALTQSEFDEAKKQLQEYASLTQKTLSDMAQQWSTFKAVRDATGNRALASQIAGLTGVRAGFNNQAEDLRSDIGASVPGVDFGRVFNMSKKEIEEYAGTLDIPKDHIQGIIDKLTKWQELQRQVINADIQSFDSLMGGLKDYDSEIQKINDRLEKQKQSNQSLVGTTDGNGRIITQAQADKANEIAEAAAADEWWKKSSTYISLMNNSLALTKEQIGAGISQAQDILNEKLRVGLISAKEYADEMERLRGITDNFNKNSMFGVSNALTAYIQGGGSGLRTFLNTQMRNANTILSSPDATRKQKEQAMQQYNSAAGRIYELDKMDSLSKLSVGFDALAKTLDPVVKMFDALGMKDVGKVVGGVQGALSGAASGATAAAALGANFGPYGAAIGAGISLLGSIGSELFGDEKERLEAEKARQETLKSIDANVEAIDYSIQKYMDKLNESYGAGALIAAENARKQEQNRQKELAFGVQASNPDSGQWWYIFRDAIANAIAGSGANVQNRWDMWTTEDPTELAKMLNWMRMNDPTIFAAMGIWGDDSHTQGKYLENLAESYDKMDEITKTLQERLSGISFEDLVSNFLDSLYEMANGAEDVFDDMEKNWKKMINKMIVNNIIGKELQEELKNFYENDFTKIYEDRKITQEERDSALASLEGIYNNYADKTKALSNLLYDISDESDSSMSSSIKGITEQTADLLASYINAIRADVSVSRQTLYQILQSMQRQSQMPVLAQAQLEELQTLVSLAKDRNNWVSEIRDILHSSQNGSRPLRVN